MATTLTVPPLHAATVDAYRGWALDFGRYDDDRTVDALLGCANQLADDLDANRVAHVTLEPGNATRYDLIVSRLDRASAGSLGGQFLISLPRQRRCYTLSLDGLWTPDYVKGAFQLDRNDDALFYAGLLSLASDRRP